MQKIGDRTKYSLVYNGVETEISCPAGWEADAVKISIDENHGFSAVSVFNLTFSDIAYDIISSAFYEKAYSADVSLIVRTRGDNYDDSIFDTLKLDFSQYVENLSSDTITIPSKRIGMKELLDTYGDAEYAIPLPSQGKTYLNFNGLDRYSINQKNIREGIPSGNSDNRGRIRTLRLDTSWIIDEYSSILYFDDSTFICKCINAGTINLDMYIKNSIYCYSDDYGKLSCTISLVIKNGDNYNTIKGFERLSYDKNGHSTFDERYTTSLSLAVNDELILSLNTNYDSSALNYVFITNDPKQYIDVKDFSASPYVNYHFEVVSYEWLIRALIEKIYLDYHGTSVIPILNFDLDTNVADMLTSGDGIRKLQDAKIKTSVNDVLKNLRKLYCTSEIKYYDTLVVKSMDDVYLNSEIKEIIPVSNIQIQSDTKYVYNLINVGCNFSVSSQDKFNGKLEPLNKQNFTIKTQNITEKKELDLVLYFVVAPTAIEEYLSTLKSKSTTASSSDNNIFMFACNKAASNNIYSLYKDYEIISLKLDHESVYNLPYSPMRIFLNNIKLIGVSSYKNIQDAIFQSSDFNSDMIVRMGYEASPIYEGINVPLSEYYFAPINVVADVAMEYDNSNGTNTLQGIGSPIRYEIYDTKHDIRVTGFSTDVTINVTENKKQTISLRYDSNR